MDAMTLTWNTWDVRELNALVYPPARLKLRWWLLDPRDNTTCELFDWRQHTEHLGPHSSDGAYSAIDIRWGEAHLTCANAAEGARAVCQITPGHGAAQLHIVIALEGVWGETVAPQRVGEKLFATASGMRWRLQANRPALVMAGSQLHFALDAPLLLEIAPDESSAAALTPEMLDAARDMYAARRLRGDGWLEDAVDGMTRVIHWNTIWEPIKRRVCTPVSRDWCRDYGGFGAYVLFDWDTFFCALMANLERPDLAAANARAMLEEMTPRGFVPNFGSANGASEDRSQPPVGAYCMLKLYRAAALGEGDTHARAALASAYPALLRWHDWWFSARDGNGDSLLEWGSDATPAGSRDWEAHNRQAAMYESGLDNSPMWDDIAFNQVSNTLELADVGLNALYALDAWALAEIARELWHQADAARLEAEYQEIGMRINAELWNEQAGIYQNKRWDGSFSPRLSPTLFYPLLAGIVPPERAERMLREHLLNEREFWGEYVLPSIARNDAAFNDQIYWRGRIWAPMHFLVAEGLRRCRLDEAAYQVARRGLRLFLGEWQTEGHVHENYNAMTGDGDDTRWSDPLYTWGALLAYVATQELADCEPWAGWRFGNMSGEAASLRGLHAGASILDIETGPHGLHVARDGMLLLAVDAPAQVTNYQLTERGLRCRVALARGPAILLLGGLPAKRTVAIRQGAQQFEKTVSERGILALPLDGDADIALEFR